MASVILQVMGFLSYWLLPKLLTIGTTVGISVAVVTPILNNLQNLVLSKLNGMPADAIMFFRFVGVFDCVSIIFSAYAVAIGLRAMNLATSKLDSIMGPK